MNQRCHWPSEKKPWQLSSWRCRPCSLPEGGRGATWPVPASIDRSIVADRRLGSIQHPSPNLCKGPNCTSCCFPERTPGQVVCSVLVVYIDCCGRFFWNDSVLLRCNAAPSACGPAGGEFVVSEARDFRNRATVPTRHSENRFPLSSGGLVNGTKLTLPAATYLARTVLSAFAFEVHQLIRPALER
jgi:hypothetical protein